MIKDILIEIDEVCGGRSKVLICLLYKSDLHFFTSSSPQQNLQNKQNDPSAPAPTPTSQPILVLVVGCNRGVHCLSFSHKQMSARGKISIYIHFPYCTAKCSYCNFNKYLLPSQVDFDRFTTNIIKDLDFDLKSRALEASTPTATATAPTFISSIYFGGGTPSLSSPRLVSRVLEFLYQNPSTRVTGETEVTLEANPTGVEAGKLSDFKSAGINRLSLGVQSLNEATLKYFNRDHTAKEALQACEIAKNTCDNVSLDFIYGVAGQKIQDWRRELQTVTRDFAPSHLSLYQLSIERGTPLFKDVKSRISSDLMADFFHATREEAAIRGYDQYEISSFALGDLEKNKSTHNLGYWSSRDYIGVGPGAHGRVVLSDGKRYRFNRIASPSQWSSQVEKEGHGIAKRREIKDSELKEERLVVGLRQTCGIDMVENATLMEIIDKEQLSLFTEKGLLEKSSTHLMCTQMGLAVSDALAIQLLKSDSN